jgi:hypothetical protein
MWEGPRLQEWLVHYCQCPALDTRSPVSQGPREPGWLTHPDVFHRHLECLCIGLAPSWWRGRRNGRDQVFSSVRNSQSKTQGRYINQLSMVP